MTPIEIAENALELTRESLPRVIGDQHIMRHDELRDALNAALRDALNVAIGSPPPPHNIVRTWGKCPVCGEGGMQKDTVDAEGAALIHCVNHACASNGGDNVSGIIASTAILSEGIVAGQKTPQKLCADTLEELLDALKRTPRDDLVAKVKSVITTLHLLDFEERTDLARREEDAEVDETVALNTATVAELAECLSSRLFKQDTRLATALRLLAQGKSINEIDAAIYPLEHADVAAAHEEAKALRKDMERVKADLEEVAKARTHYEETSRECARLRSQAKAEREVSEALISSLTLMHGKAKEWAEKAIDRSAIPKAAVGVIDSAYNCAEFARSYMHAVTDHDEAHREHFRNMLEAWSSKVLEHFDAEGNLR